MNKLDITKEMLYIKNPRRVIRSALNFHGKPNFVSSRVGDGFIYVLSGGCRYDFDDGVTLCANAGDILYLADRAKYRMLLSSEIYEVIYVDFIFESEALRQSACFTTDPAMGAEALFKKLHRVYTSTEVECRANVLSFIYSIYATAISSRGKGYIGRDAMRRISIAKEYVEEHYADPDLSVRMLADKAGMSEVYFRKQFKAVYRISPIEYMTSVRLENAKHLMEYSPISLEECARSCGFSSVQYFCRVFSKINGITPAKYRREL